MTARDVRPEMERLARDGDIPGVLDRMRRLEPPTPAATAELFEQAAPMTHETTADMGELEGGTARCANTERPLTHHSREREGGLAMDATPNDGRLIFTDEDLANSEPIPPSQPEPMTDIDRGMVMFEALGIGSVSSRMILTVIPGIPWSKARPKFTRAGRTYVDPKDRAAQERTAGALRRTIRGEPFDGNVALGCVFFRPTLHRIDADNMLKHVCDAATGIVWADDSQCTAVMGAVELDRDNPRTIIVLGEHSSSMPRGINAAVPCPVCGKPVMPNRTNRATCSQQCARVASQRPRSDEPILCRVCQLPFVPRQKREQVCSEQCRKAHLAAVSRDWRAQHPRAGLPPLTEHQDQLW